MRILHLIGAAVLALPACAGEYAVLSNGLRIHADRHEADGPAVKLYSGEGYTQLPADSIASFEQDDLAPATASAGAAPSDKAVSLPLQPPPADIAAEAARKYSLPESFVRSVMRAESGFNPNAISPKGAIGLMQLMPGTARELGVDPANPKENANGGAQYLRELLAKYEGDPDQVLLALAAYNAGPAAVEKFHGVPPYRETREYILRVLKNWDQKTGGK